MNWIKLSDKFPDRDDYYPVKLQEMNEDGKITVASDYFTGFCFCFPNVVEWWEGKTFMEMMENPEEVSPEGEETGI